MVIQTVGLHQVDDVKPVWFSGLRVRNTKVEPLCVTSCVIVWLENQVILVLVHLDCPSQITTFKSRLKKKCVVISTLRNVEWRNFAIDWGNCLLARLSARVWTRINAVIDNSIHEGLLVSYSFSLSTQRFLQNKLLWRIKRLKVTNIFYKLWWILQ